MYSDGNKSLWNTLFVYKTLRKNKDAMYSVWCQGGRGYLTVYYTSSQSFFIRWLNNFGNFLLNFDWLVHKVECQH